VGQTGRPIANLSACSTSQNRNSRLLNEGLHLASGMQLAGFRHVIAKLWNVSDYYSVTVAKTFYKSLKREGGFFDGAVRLALHHSIRVLRDRAVVSEKGKQNLKTPTESLSDQMESSLAVRPTSRLGSSENLVVSDQSHWNQAFIFDPACILR
jgi:CHAT domain